MSRVPDVGYSLESCEISAYHSARGRLLMRYAAAIAGAMFWMGAAALAEDLTVSLPGVEITRIHTRFECGPEGVALGLPSGPFPVEYINAGENHLALLPLRGKQQILASVISASGARYAAGRYIWWDAGDRGVTLYAEGINSHRKADCHLVKKQQRL